MTDMSDPIIHSPAERSTSPFTDYSRSVAPHLIPVRARSTRAEPPEGMHAPSAAMVESGTPDRYALTSGLLQLFTTGRLFAAPVWEDRRILADRMSWRITPGPRREATTPAAEEVARCLARGGVDDTLANRSRAARRPLGKMRREITNATYAQGWLARSMVVWSTAQWVAGAIALWLAMQLTTQPRSLERQRVVLIALGAVALFVGSRWGFQRVSRGRPTETAAAIAELSARLRVAEEPEFATPAAGEHFTRYLPWAVATGNVWAWCAGFERGLEGLQRHDPLAQAEVLRSLEWFVGPAVPGGPTDPLKVMGGLRIFLDHLWTVVDDMYDSEERQSRAHNHG